MAKEKAERDELMERAVRAAEIAAIGNRWPAVSEFRDFERDGFRVIEWDSPKGVRSVTAPLG